MTEVWKNIKDFEELYQVSNFGNVKSLKRNIILKPAIISSRGEEKMDIMQLI